MKKMFLGMTLGADPHTVGIYRAGRIAKMLGINTKVISPSASDEEKVRTILELRPEYTGLSYRLSADKGVAELQRFLKLLETTSPAIFKYSKFCFAALPETLRAVHELGFDKKYGLTLEGQGKTIRDTTIGTLRYFDAETHPKSQKILELFQMEAEPERIELLDEIAQEVVHGDAYQSELPLKKPSNRALGDFVARIDESEYPVLRTHFGIPAETITPTVEGIARIADAGVVDEISLGSSDLSQRFFGRPEAFADKKNDGGVPYKTKEDLYQLYLAACRGNYPSMKPYCHVTNIKEFVDICLQVGMLRGGHQAVPLFWFSELDGRGPMRVDEAIDEHIDAVRYLVQKGIPTEMNDPNQWSSRLAHDTVFVADYALIASVMYAAGSPNMIFQCQFNKPVETGDFADLAKFKAARNLIHWLNPNKNSHRILLESRAGIEHFSVDQEYAKYQLARTTLLQMLISPSIVHLVSYCEAVHAAHYNDVVESSKLVRRAMRLFRENEPDIRRAAAHPYIEERSRYLEKEAKVLLNEIARQSLLYQKDVMTASDYVKCLSDPSALKAAMKKRLMTAPGIMNVQYANPGILTHAGPYGAIDCYKNWEDLSPQTEAERLEL